jgi:uncharacterized protein (TIGR03083 family)
VESRDYIDIVRNRSVGLLVSARTDLTAPIPSCPGWTMAELIAHVGGTWGWVAGIVSSGERRGEFPTIPNSITGSDLISLVEERVRQLLQVLEGADPAANCWTFGLPRSALFWFRRQALETAIHAWDAEGAVAHPAPIDADLACDGIDEFLAVMLPRQVKGNPDIWTGQSLHLHRTDGDGEWLVQLGPDGETTYENAHGKGDVALRGPASSLYLWCLNRIPRDDLEVFGDRAVAHQWRSDIAF